MAKHIAAPSGFRNISTTHQIAYETYAGDVQVRKLSSKLWEVLPRGAAVFYEASKKEALERAFQLSAGVASKRSRAR